MHAEIAHPLLVEKPKRHCHAGLPPHLLGHIHDDPAPPCRTACHILFPNNGSIHEDLLEVIAGGRAGEVIPLAKGQHIPVGGQYLRGLARYHEVARLRGCVAREAQFARRDHGRIVEDGPSCLDLLAVLQIRHDHAVNDFAVVLGKLGCDLVKVHQGQKSQARVDAFRACLHLAQIGRREEGVVGVEIVDHPRGQVGMLERQLRNLFRPALVVQAEWLGILAPVLRRALGRRHQIHPDLDPGLCRVGQKQLQVVPVRRRVPDEPVVGGDAQLLQACDHRVAIHTTVRTAEFRVIIGQVLPEEPLGLRLRHLCLAHHPGPDDQCDHPRLHTLLLNDYRRSIHCLRPANYDKLILCSPASWRGHLALACRGHPARDSRAGRPRHEEKGGTPSPRRGCHLIGNKQRRPPMRARRSFGFRLALSVCVGWALAHQMGSGEASPTLQAAKPRPASISPSWRSRPVPTSPATRRSAALNDGYDPRSSRDNRRGSYGNWPRRGTQWVQYDWSQPISTNKIDVYWWDDQQGVRLPKACRLLYWDGNAFVPVANAVRSRRRRQPIQHHDLRRGPDRQAPAGDRLERNVLDRHPGMEGL